MMQKKMKEMEQKEISSKSLLANVLDIDDDFMCKSPPFRLSSHPSHSKPFISNGASTRSSTKSLVIEDTSSISPPIKKELGLILKEIRVITDKIRDDEDSSSIEG